MKLQPASLKEVKRLAVGEVICLGIELVGFLALHILGVFSFGLRTVVSAAVGVIISLLSFVILCLAVQKAAGMTDNQKAMKARMQLSYNLRLLLQAGWVVVAFAAPFLQVLPAAAPLLFPTCIIFYLTKKGKLVTPSERKNPEPSDEDEEEEDHLESFEI